MPNKDIPVQILVSLAAAALWGFVQGESMSVLGAVQIGYFEVAFLVALCVVMILTKVILPWLDGWLLEPGRRDREDFNNLLEDAKGVRAEYVHRSHSEQPSGEAERAEALHQEHDLQTHLELLGVRFFYRDQPLFRDLALLIKLMQRGDLKQAQERWPAPQGSEVESVPSLSWKAGEGSSRSASGVPGGDHHFAT